MEVVIREETTRNYQNFETQKASSGGSYGEESGEEASIMKRLAKAHTKRDVIQRLGMQMEGKPANPTTVISNEMNELQTVGSVVEYTVKRSLS